jgi:DNA-binding XRE family transcriptional regulator
MTKRDIAGYLNIDYKTLYNWEKYKPNLYKTVMLGLMVDEIIEKSQKNVDELITLKSSFDTKKQILK